jgi:hypothetical protein
VQGTNEPAAAALLADGEIDKAGYEMVRDNARAELEVAEAELGRMREAEHQMPALLRLEVVLAETGGWRTALLAGKVAEQREVLAALVERAVPVRLGWGRYRVDVEWTPLGQALLSVWR